MEHLSATIKHHIPLAVLFRDHWPGVLLQFLIEAAYGTAFYTFFTYIPSYLSKELHIPASNTLWALLIGLVLFAVAVPLSGHFISDRKVGCRGLAAGDAGWLACRHVMLAAVTTAHETGCLMFPSGLLPLVMTWCALQWFPKVWH